MRLDDNDHNVGGEKYNYYCILIFFNVSLLFNFECTPMINCQKNEQAKRGHAKKPRAFVLILISLLDSYSGQDIMLDRNSDRQSCNYIATLNFQR